MPVSTTESRIAALESELNSLKAESKRQLTLKELDDMTPIECDKARREGRLDELLGVNRSNGYL